MIIFAVSAYVQGSEEEKKQSVRNLIQAREGTGGLQVQATDVGARTQVQDADSRAGPTTGQVQPATIKGTTDYG